MADTVSDLFSGIATLKLQWSRIDAQEVGSVTNKKTATATYAIGDDTAAGSADKVYAETRTIDANGVDEIDCAALTQQSLGVSVPFAFSQIRLVRITNEETQEGRYLYVGAAPSDPFNVFAWAVGPGSEVMSVNKTNAWLVNSSNAKFYISNPNGSQLSYSIVLIGS